MKTLARGSMLRISADVTGGLPLDHWKTRSIRHPSEGPFEALCNVYRQQGGVKAFWAGLPAKLIEGSLCGGLLLVGKEGCKTTLTRAVTRMRLPVGEAAIGAVAGVAGGVAQCAVLTPSTFLVMTAATTGCSVMETVSKIARGERKFTDLYTGGGGLVMREATNWASRITKALQKEVKSGNFRNKMPDVWWGHGGTDDREREEMVVSFRKSDGPCLLIGTGQAFGESVDGLQTADLAIFAMLPWKPGDFVQWKGRFDRLGGSATLLKVVVATGTYDERVVEILVEKFGPIESFLKADELEGLGDKLLGMEDEQALVSSIINKLEVT